IKLSGLGLIAEGVAHAEQAAALEPSPGYTSAALFAQSYRSDLSPEALFERHLDWQRHVEAPTPPRRLAPRARDADRRLRVGFVSADLYGHPVGRFLLPLLDHLDRAAFETTCYPSNRRSDPVTAQLMARADHWRPLGSTAADAAAMIADDGIDILVDLGGHTSGDVLEIFAHRPAPLQVTWLGYPNTTGMTRIDYRLTDAVADPPGAADALSSERLIRLPAGFHCFIPPAAAPEVGPLPAGRDGPITFGSLNALAKLSDATLAAWARVLEATPGSRLMIRRSGLAAATARDALTARCAAQGIDGTRLLLVAGGAGGSFEAYRDIDIALDCFPYNGTTTTCDALWMGVPVVTWAGDRHAARVGASLLHRVGLDALVGQSTDDFVAIAARLAGDRAALSALRATLRGRMAASPLCDGPGFARAVGGAFRRIWQERCGSKDTAQP
ncbi:MAG: hypothetical protein JO021_00830, partial [Alphaproteobacteria bacterium]|nr:hypothetical protein [Alphaproteobacteria bacterium]